MAVTHLRILFTATQWDSVFFGEEVDLYHSLGFFIGPDAIDQIRLVDSEYFIDEFNGFFGPWPDRLMPETSMGAVSVNFDFDVGSINNIENNSIATISYWSAYIYNAEAIIFASNDNRQTWYEIGSRYGFDGENVTLDWDAVPPPPPTTRGNVLRKVISTSYIPGSPGVPGNPGQPYRPAGTYYVTQTVCGWEWPEGVSMVRVQMTDAMGRTYWTWVPDIPLNSGIQQIWMCRQKQVGVYRPAQPYIPPTPAIPPTPSQAIVEYNLGWNSGARSILSADHGGRFDFSVSPSVVGAVVGLNGSDQNGGYVEIKHGFYCATGIARIIESGVEIGPSFTYVESDVFSVQRVEGEVTYLLNGDLLYTSLVPSTGEMFLDTSMYSGGDEIYNAEFVGVGVSYTSFSPMIGAGTASTLYAESHTELQPLSGWSQESADYARSHTSFRLMDGAARESDGYASGHTSFRPMTGYGLQPPTAASHTEFAYIEGVASEGAYARSYTSLQPLTGHAEGGFIQPSYGVAHSSFVMLSGESEMLTGEIADAHSELQPLTGMSAETEYARSHTEFLPLNGYSEAFTGPESAQLFVRIPARAVFQSSSPSTARMIGRGKLVATLNMSGTLTASMIGRGKLKTTFGLTSKLLASMVVKDTAAPFFYDPSAQNTTWAINAETGASTRYEGYDYNSFAEINGRYYGAKSDGIYLLNGNDDNGEPIDARVGFGKQDFGTSAHKTVSNAYIGVASEGNLFMTVTVGDNEYTYPTRNYGENLATQRADLGRGLKANYIEFELHNCDGEDFELSSVEFVAASLNRRI